jgi:Asp-tRNA(Asn)/Glu-tRNA(Gln) amidotransferase A subunit family amidase
VRDAARYFDVCGGAHPLDPSSLPRRTDWERNLGTNELRGKRVAVVPALGGVTLESGVEENLRASTEQLVKNNDMQLVDLTVNVPNIAAQWMMGNLATLLDELGDAWPGCARDLTDEIAVGLFLSQSMYNLHTAAVAEGLRLKAYAEMANAFEQVDFVIAATNPGPAFAADAATSSPTSSFIDSVKASRAAQIGFRAVMGGVRLAGAAFPKLPAAILEQFSEKFPDLVRMGALTIVSNIYGNPAVSIPSGLIDGLPVGMQVLARHHADELLFDVALSVERNNPWPLVATPQATTAPAR